MPVYNAAPYLEGCLDSIRDQSLSDWELVAINDGSQDDSFAILNSYAGQDDRIRVYNNRFEKGIIGALQTAFSLSSGDFITRMDADDKMPKDKLALLFGLLDEYGVGTLATGRVSYFSDQELRGGYLRYAQWLNDLCIHDNHWEEIFKECVIASPAWMIAREDFIQCGAFDNDIYPEDYDLVFRFYLSGLKVRSSPEIVHFWRDHQERSSRNDPHYKDNAYLDLKLIYLKKIFDLKTKELILWGGGKKAKHLAKALANHSLSFRWVCNNSQKWGKEIYGIKMENSKSIISSGKELILVGISGPEDQKELTRELENRSFKKGISYCFFY